MKFVLNQAGVRELLQGPEMAAIISAETERVATIASSSSGLNYVGDVITGKTRSVGHVSAGDEEAYRKNLEHNYLLKALGGAGK